MLESPEELRKELILLFPSIEEELANDVDYFGHDKPLTYHYVWFCFRPFVGECLENTNEKGLKAFCKIINTMVLAGGDKENAVSTCLLEHASQIGIRKLIKPFLVSEAKLELR